MGMTTSPLRPPFSSQYDTTLECLAFHGSIADASAAQGETAMLEMIGGLSNIAINSSDPWSKSRSN